MPVITIEGAQLNIDQKRELVKTLTKDAANIMNLSEQLFIVLIKETDMENMGIGGNLAADNPSYKKSRKPNKE